MKSAWSDERRSNTLKDGGTLGAPAFLAVLKNSCGKEGL